MFASRWLQLEIICPTTLAETLGALMIEGGSLGVQERDLDDAHPQTAQPGALLIAFFDADFPREQQRDIESMLSNFGDEVSILHWSEHRDDGWSTRWKSFFHPLPIGEQIVICPTWEEFTPTPTQKVIHIDPGMAFGTGTHETTALMAKALYQNISNPKGKTLLDVGTGTGILAILGAYMGFEKIRATDTDVESQRVANENFELNQVSVLMNHEQIEEIHETYDVVLANIIEGVLSLIQKELFKKVNPQGVLFLSGILADNKEEFLKEFQLPSGAQWFFEKQEGEWLCFGAKWP